MDNLLSDDPEIDRRLAAATAAFYSLRQEVYASQNVKLKTKAFLYMALVVTILTCGAEPWKLSAAQMRRLQSFHRKCVRTFYRITLHQTWKHRITTASLLKRCGADSMHDIMKKKSLSWLGHVARMSPHRLPKLLTFAWVPHKRPIGRPPSNYHHRALAFIKSTLPFIQTTLASSLAKPHATPRWYRNESHDAIANWHLVSQNRPEWRKIVICKTSPKK